MLAPLSELTGKKPFSWNDEKEQAFKEMRAILVNNCLNAYPDYNKNFHIYTDASKYQLGAAIIQNGCPIAYYSRKLTDAQQAYTNTEKESLVIVLCLKEYQRILYGAKIHVYTDHTNLIFRTLSVEQVLRLRVFIDKFDLTLQCIEGKKNILANCFLRLPLIERSISVEDESKVMHD